VVVGYPNVGKSSLINRLLRRKKCEAAPRPGVTRELKYCLHLRRNICCIIVNLEGRIIDFLVDCICILPLIAFADGLG
jgi:GTP-binding protein EngB required for normal cell division